jgi:hypothetical protein
MSEQHCVPSKQHWPEYSDFDDTGASGSPCHRYSHVFLSALKASSLMRANEVIE